MAPGVSCVQATTALAISALVALPYATSAEPQSFTRILPVYVMYLLVTVWAHWNQVHKTFVTKIFIGAMMQVHPLTPCLPADVALFRQLA